MVNQDSYMLFARPSFLEGMACILDFGDTLTEYNTAPNPETADYLALKADLAALRQDWESACLQLQQESSEEELVLA